MTTLPQTTPMRLPRPAGAGQIAIPSAPVPGTLGPAAAGGGAQMTGADVWRVFRSNWWLILGLATLTGIGGYFANGYLKEHHPRYTATALVKIQLPEEVFRPRGFEGSSPPQTVELEQKTHAANLMSQKLMLDTIRDSEALRNTQWYRDFADEKDGQQEAAKEDLLKHFTSQPRASTRLITVEMTYRVPKDARVIVEEVVEKYIRGQQENYRVRWEEESQKLQQQFDDAARDYRAVTNRLTDRQAKLGSENLVAYMSLLQGKGHEHSRLTEQLIAASRDLREHQSTLDALEAMIASGETPPEIEGQLFEDALLAEFQRELSVVETRLGAAGGPNSPTYGGMASRRQQLQQQIEDRSDKLRNAKLEERRYELRSKAAAAKGAKEEMDESLKLVEVELRAMQAAAAEYRTLEAEQKVLKEKMDQFNEDLQRLRHQKLASSWGPVEWASKPPTPETPSFPKLPIVMGMAILLGLALSIGIAFLREITDTSVRSPRDIARVGNLTLLGMIPHESDDPQSAGARLPLVIFDAPHSVAAEEFRKLRTRLQHAASLDSTRSILVSSANPGDGKTTVACNLAAGLALNGRRILLVDANFRRPEIHNLFEVANERGFSDALNDLSTFDTLVRDTPVQNLYVMPTGPKPVNATELLESQLLIDFIERALEDYDHVIFDSGPLLVVSETMALAPRVDGVVTVVRARTNSRGVLQRMRDGLRQVKAEHLGVVLNAVRSQGGGYYGRNIKAYYAYQNGA